MNRKCSPGWCSSEYPDLSSEYPDLSSEHPALNSEYPELSSEYPGSAGEQKMFNSGVQFGAPQNGDDSLHSTDMLTLPGM